jgi:hypothetical protein
LPFSCNVKDLCKTNMPIGVYKISVHHFLDFGVMLIIPSPAPIAGGRMPSWLELPTMMVPHWVWSPWMLPHTPCENKPNHPCPIPPPPWYPWLVPGSHRGVVGACPMPCVNCLPPLCCPAPMPEMHAPLLLFLV